MMRSGRQRVLSMPDRRAPVLRELVATLVIVKSVASALAVGELYAAVSAFVRQRRDRRPTWT